VFVSKIGVFPLLSDDYTGLTRSTHGVFCAGKNKFWR
jgi:hypothetical protein